MAGRRERGRREISGGGLGEAFGSEEEEVGSISEDEGNSSPPGSVDLKRSEHVKPLRTKDCLRSGWPSMIECVSETSTKATGFGEDLFSCRLIESKDQFLMLKGCEESHIILIIDHNDGQRGP
jgi:hypothetical protein